MKDITLDDGKYTLRLHDDGRMDALRYGEPWRDLVGDKLIFALACKIGVLQDALASAPHAREPLNFDRLQSVMAAHFGGRELTDDEADSAEAFARAIERAHGIGA